MYKLVMLCFGISNWCGKGIQKEIVLCSVRCSRTILCSREHLPAPMVIYRWHPGVVGRISFNSFRLTMHQISIVYEESAIMSLPCPYYILSQWWPNQPWILLYLHGCLTHRGPPHSLTAAHPTCTLILSLFLRWKLQIETTLTSSLQSADLTATIVLAKFSYR